MTPRRLKDILWVLALFGGVAVVYRLLAGLGPTTDLSNGVPWGLWKVLNMIAGVALATGGFVLAFVVHVLGRKRWEPIVRPAILVALLGYGSSCFALLMDIGLPDRFWHPFLFWNVHSFLFEVFWCVTLYFTVTVIEFTPIAVEGSRFAKLHRFLKKISLPVVILGITFSTMHHTSLGSLFLMSPTRLDPIWYTPMLPVLFILSAVGAGMMSVTLVTLGVARLYRREAPLELLRRVAIASGVVLAAYLVLRIGDLAVRGRLGDIFAARYEARLFLVETLLLAILPLALLATPMIRRSGRGLAVIAGSAVAGLVLNRLDVGIFGYLRSAGVSYHPTLSEIALTVGIPAAAGLVFLALVERLNVFTSLGGPLADPDAAAGITCFDAQTTVWTRAFLGGAERVMLIVLLVVPLTVALFQATATAEPEATSPVRPPRAVDAARTVLRIDGNGTGPSVRFPHEDHAKRLGGDSSCSTCHHLDLPGDQHPACWRCHAAMDRSTSIFDHAMHERKVAEREGLTGGLAVNGSCSECHAAGVPRGGESAKRCDACHEEDMRMTAASATLRGRAPSYPAALHGSCVKCHEEKAEEVGKPDLPECSTCHPDGR